MLRKIMKLSKRAIKDCICKFEINLFDLDKNLFDLDKNAKCSVSYNVLRVV